MESAAVTAGLEFGPDVSLAIGPTALVLVGREPVLGSLGSGAHDGAGSEGSRVEWKESSSSISSSLKSLHSSSDVWLTGGSAGIVAGLGCGIARSVEGSVPGGSVPMPPAPEAPPVLPSPARLAASSSDVEAAFLDVLVVLFILDFPEFLGVTLSQSATFSC